MNGAAIEVADVLRSYGRQYLHHHPAGLLQARIIEDLTACRTAVLGGHLRECTTCGHQVIAYNSCRNRHCPKCRGQKQADWMAAQNKNLLEVPYFHIVFTLPQPNRRETVQFNKIVSEVPGLLPQIPRLSILQALPIQSFML